MPTSAARISAGGWTIASSRAGSCPTSVAPDHGECPERDGDDRRDPRAHVRPTSNTAPSVMRQARMPGSPVDGIGLVLTQRHQHVQGIRIEGETDVGRGRPRRRVRVRVDDPPEHLAGVVGRDRQAQQLRRVDLVPVR